MFCLAEVQRYGKTNKFWGKIKLTEQIITKNLSFEYKSDEESVLVIKDMNIQINKGEFVAILGHNGSGKSTLAKHFNAILLPTSGAVFIDGVDTCNQNQLFNIRKKVGMVFQNPDNQIVATIVEEDVAFALENLGVEPNEIRKRVDEALKSVDMYKYKDHAPHQLSGGQKQRIAIAGVLAMRPDCIVLDEPTAMLDPRGRKEVIDTVIDLNARYSTTVALITHYMDEAVKADRIIVVDHGQVIMEGKPKEVFKNVSKLKEIGLDVPQVTQLCYNLKKEGIDVPDDIITEEECIKVLKEILNT